MTNALERARIPLLVVSILVFCTGVVGAMTYDDDDTTTTSAAGGSTTTAILGTVEGRTPEAAPDDGGTDAETPDAGVDPDASPGDPATPTSEGDAPRTTEPSATTSAPATTPAPATTGDPGPSLIPAAGVYTYEVVSDSGDGPETSSSTTTIELLSGDRTNGRFRTTMERDGEGLVSEATGAAEGFVVETSVVKSAFGDSDECVWKPAFTIMPRLAPGVTWSFQSTCDTTISGADVTITISGTGRVVGTEVVPVLGEQREVWILETTTTTEADIKFGADTFEQDSEQTSTARFDPKLGAEVSSESVVMTSGQQSGRENVRTTLAGYKA